MAVKGESLLPKKTQAKYEISHLEFDSTGRSRPKHDQIGRPLYFALCINCLISGRTKFYTVKEDKNPLARNSAEK